MESALTSAQSSSAAQKRTGIIALFVALLFISCTSPMDLDVDRNKTYIDGGFHPKRMTFLYYYGDTACEAIISDTSMLNQIWVETGAHPYTVSIPWFVFDLPDTIQPTPKNTPFVKRLSFSIDKFPVDGIYDNVVSELTWFDGVYLDLVGNQIPFHWLADRSGRKLRMAWTCIYSERLLKGSIQIVVVDPVDRDYVTYRAQITLEY